MSQHIVGPFASEGIYLEAVAPPTDAVTVDDIAGMDIDNANNNDEKAWIKMLKFAFLRSFVLSYLNKFIWPEMCWGHCYLS